MKRPKECPPSAATLRRTDNESREAIVEQDGDLSDRIRKADSEWAKSAPREAAQAASAAAAALPCLNSNNSDKRPKRYRLKKLKGHDDLYQEKGNDRAIWKQVDGDTIQRFGTPNAAEAKAAFHLRLNVESFIQYFGRDHCLFFTITDEHNLHPSKFARRWNNFLRRHGDWIRSFIRVLEPQKKGRPHYHLLVAVDWDTKPEKFDWQAFDECQREIRENGRSATFRKLRKRYRDSAAPELVAMWAYLRTALKTYGLGRSELLPLRKNQEAVSEYIGKYLEAGLILRKHSWKGCRRIEFDRKLKKQWIVCTRRFSWNSPGARTWRKRIGELASRLGISTVKELRSEFGRRWAYHLRAVVTNTSDEAWQGFLAALQSTKSQSKKRPRLE